jgi:acyl carrier protein phosphodiesterase
VNYLAHAYLSFGIPEIVVGNLISDFVKGRKKLDYPPGIQRGIALHRAIDTFTDTHAVTRRAKGIFRAAYGLYAGALLDVAYDHFLANDEEAFAGVDGGGVGAGGQGEAGEDPGGSAAAVLGARLKAFSQRTYAQAEEWEEWFPERFRRIFPYMRAQDWLYHYRYREGIYNSFAGLARRAAYMPDTTIACRLFDEHYSELGACYREFFPALKEFANITLEEWKGR